jgi:hypothetical protein
MRHDHDVVKDLQRHESPTAAQRHTFRNKRETTTKKTLDEVTEKVDDADSLSRMQWLGQLDRAFNAEMTVRKHG